MLVQVLHHIFLYHSCLTFNWDSLYVTVLEGFKGPSPCDALKELTELVSSFCSALLAYLTEDFMAIFSLIEECPRKRLMTLFILNIPAPIQKKNYKERRWEPKITSGS